MDKKIKLFLPNMMPRDNAGSEASDYRRAKKWAQAAGYGPAYARSKVIASRIRNLHKKGFDQKPDQVY